MHRIRRRGFLTIDLEAFISDPLFMSSALAPSRMNRRLRILAAACALALVVLFGESGRSPGRESRAQRSTVRGDPARLARIQAATMPEITRPVPFDTSEADEILAALEVFPPDNPWNLLVDDWPVHADSKE